MPSKVSATQQLISNISGDAGLPVVGVIVETGVRVSSAVSRAAARFVFLVFLLPMSLYGQQLATLNITVTDPSGSAIPEARITLRNLATGAKRTVLCSGTGIAVVPALSAGSYQLTVESDAFASYRVALTLAVGQIASLPVALKIKTARETVDVHQMPAGVDTQRPEMSQVIETEKISDLPIAGRNFIDFVLLTPTANVGRNTAVGAQSPFQETVLELSFGGLRETHSTFYGLDGVDYTTSVSGVQRASPSQDWVSEFRVADGPITADNGRNLGSVVNTVTKSGSNYSVHPITVTHGYWIIAPDGSRGRRSIASLG
jgi:Carboxypeptidase regulatory-like domain